MRAPLGLALAFLSVQAQTFTCGAGDVAWLIAAITKANSNGAPHTIRLEAGAWTLPIVDNDQARLSQAGPAAVGEGLVIHAKEVQPW